MSTSMFMFKNVLHNGFSFSKHSCFFHYFCIPIFLIFIYIYKKMDGWNCSYWYDSYGARRTANNAQIMWYDNKNLWTIEKTGFFKMSLLSFGNPSQNWAMFLCICFIMIGLESIILIYNWIINYRKNNDHFGGRTERGYVSVQNE